MTELKGFQKKYLRGISHGLKAVVLIGREGLTDGLLKAVDEGLSQHELIKVKFNDFKEKGQKAEITGEITARTGSGLAGLIGHTAILYRAQADPLRRRIRLPEREG